MNKALVNFSFDDGRIDNYTIAYPILKEFGLPATFNITTGYISKELDKNGLTLADPMTVDMVKELGNDEKMELAGHGHLHKNSLEDISAGIACLSKMRFEREYGFASPGSGLKIQSYRAHQKDFNVMNIAYIRTSLRYKNNSFIKSFMRKVCRVIHLPFLYSYSYSDTLLDKGDCDVLYSVPILSNTSVQEIKALINLAIKKKKALILMFHSIVPDRQIRDLCDFEESKFIEICKYLKEKEDAGVLDNTTSMHIHKIL